MTIFILRTQPVASSFLPHHRILTSKDINVPLIRLFGQLLPLFLREGSSFPNPTRNEGPVPQEAWPIWEVNGGSKH